MPNQVDEFMIQAWATGLEVLVSSDWLLGELDRLERRKSRTPEMARQEVGPRVDGAVLTAGNIESTGIDDA